MEMQSVHQPLAKRSLSTSTFNWRHNLHPLLSRQGQIRVRAHFTIADWLLIGSFLQAVVVLLTPLRPIHALAPTFLYALYKVLRFILKIYGVVDNPLMRNVFPGRQSAVFPEPDGSQTRAAGDSVGGGSMAIVLLSNKCNHPLGLFYPKYREMGQYGRAMYIDLEKNPEEYGFLGYSDFNSNTVSTQPQTMSIMYFKSIEHVHKWAHGTVHRAGWDWWSEEQKAGRVDHITIAHEIYGVDRGKWENVYLNAAPQDFGATAHAIKAAGGEKQWVCPLMDANRGFRTSAQRLGNVKE